MKSYQYDYPFYHIFLLIISTNSNCTHNYINKYSFLKKKMKKPNKRDETVDRFKCISEIVTELIKAYDKNEKINLTRVRVNFNIKFKD